MKKAPKVRTNKSSPKSKEEIQKLAKGSWVENANSSLEGKEGLIGTIGNTTADLATLGGTAIAAKNVANDQGQIDVRKSTTSSALTGAGTGIKTGLALGTAVGGPIGAIIGAGGGALIGGTVGAIAGNKKAKRSNVSAAANAYELKQQEQEAQRQSILAQAMYNRNLENFAEGGKVKGYGNGGSVPKEPVISNYNKTKRTPESLQEDWNRFGFKDYPFTTKVEEDKDAKGNIVYNYTLTPVPQNIAPVTALSQTVVKKTPQLDPMKQSSYTGMLPTKVEQYNEGGKIKGKGTAKSDSITAKIKEGSFIVPAENGKIAEEIREKVLVKPPKAKANLNQKGGETVKVSNSEHLFTPEEAMQIENELGEGILDKLAPNAEESKEMKSGGRLSAAKAKEILRDGTIRNQPITEKQRKYFGWVAGGSKADGGMVKGYADGGKTNFDPAKESERIKKENAKKEAYNKQFEAEIKNYETARKLEKENYERIKYLNQLAKTREKKVEEYNKLAAAKKGSASIYDQEELLKKSNEIADLDKEVNTVKSTVNKVATKVATGDYKDKTKAANETKPVEAAKADYVTTDRPSSDVTTSPQLAGNGNVETDENPTFTTKRKVPVPTKTTTQAKETLPDVTFDPMQKAMADNPDVTPEIKQTSALAKETTPTLTTTETKLPTTDTTLTKGGNNDKETYDKIGSVLSQAMSYGIPIAQTAIGINALNKAGKRPVNTIPSDYLGMIDQANAATALAQQNAKYGFTPEEAALLNQQNQNATNAGIYAARNLSGGSAANALNNTRSALADSFGRNLQTKVQNRDLMLQKQDIANQRQQYANNLIAGKTALLNNIFDQKLQGWQQQQQAGAGLVGAGLQNLSGLERYNEFLKQQKALNK